MKINFFILLAIVTISESVFAIQAPKAPYVGNTLNNSACNGNPVGYGPFDYSMRSSVDPNGHHLELVESAHFTPAVENLIAGNTSGTPWGDLDYTLRAWPNHEKALLSIIRYQLQVKNRIRNDNSIKIPPECYLQRAIHFSPADPIPYSLYGYYLKKLGRLQDAVKFYKKAIDLEPENPKFAYAFSLLLIDLKQYDEALNYARIAYQHGKPPISLRKKLEKLGVWK